VPTPLISVGGGAAWLDIGSYARQLSSSSTVAAWAGTRPIRSGTKRACSRGCLIRKLPGCPMPASTTTGSPTWSSSMSRAIPSTAAVIPAT